MNEKKLSLSDSQRACSGSSTQQEPSPSLLPTIQQSRKTLAWCLALTPGILLYGYDLVIVGNVSSMPEFRKDFGRRLHNKLIIPALWLGLWNIANPIGGILGALSAGSIQDLFGRRRSLTLSTIISALGVAVAYVSDLPDDINTRRSVFFLAKLIQGFAVNMLMCTTQTYMSEVLPPLLRGPVLAFFPIFTLLGQLIGSIVVYVSLDKPEAEGYKNCFISEWAVCLLPLLVSFCMPESPVYLIRRNRVEDARESQRRLACSSQDAEITLDNLIQSIKLETQSRAPSTATYLACLTTPHHHRTLIVLFANLLPSIFGVTLLSKGSYFMQVVGMSAHNSLLCLQVGLGLGLLANVCSMYTLSRFGRVTLTLVGLAGCGVLWTGMGVAGCFEGTVVIWYTQTTFLLVIILAGMSTWPASYAIAAETSSLHLRAKSQGLGWLVNCLLNGVLGLVLPYIFNEDEGALKGKTGFVYTGFCVIGLVVTWLFVPELKDLSVQEVDGLFESRGRRDGGGDGET
ncbi:general substrate transporter [Aspergillus karnatakaensis]|uniref:general substrate transporter n=1 Tax=Aspergillus karnatakaensis TaxID=1810916 RepID=UPI003CCE3458